MTTTTTTTSTTTYRTSLVTREYVPTSPRDIPTSINQPTGWLAGREVEPPRVGVDGVRPRTGARVRDDFKLEPAPTTFKTTIR